MSIYQTLADIEKRGEAAVLCTILGSQGSTPRHEGSKMIVYPDGRIEGSVGGGEIENRVITEALKALEEGRGKLVEYNMVDPAKGDPGICGGEARIYLEPILPRPVVVVVGGGHVGKAVSHLAKWLGFRVVVSDDRAEFCTPEANPDADEFVCAAMNDIPQEYQLTAYTYVILTTRGMVIDVPGLPALLKSSAGYIGIIGSKRRWSMTRKALMAEGITAEQLARVHSPIGLELKAETPEEIAVSIMAEIIMLRNGGTGEIMKMKVD